MDSCTVGQLYRWQMIKEPNGKTPKQLDNRLGGWVDRQVDSPAGRTAGKQLGTWVINWTGSQTGMNATRQRWRLDS